MENPSSPLDTLRQLKEMLDAGALTPAEFDALKQRLVLAPGGVGAAPAAPPVAPAPETSAEPAGPRPASGPVAGPWRAPETPADLPLAAGGPAAYAAAPEPAAYPDDVPAEYADDEPEADAQVPAERSSSLGLLLAIGAVLVFLAVVAYLGLTRPTTDEHISSISQTAADSLGTTIETGPQVAPLPATTAAPETVRVAPTNPAPVIQPRPAVPVADSVVPATNSPAVDSAGNQ